MNFQNLNFDYVEPPRGTYPKRPSHPQTPSSPRSPARTRRRPSSASEGSQGASTIRPTRKGATFNDDDDDGDYDDGDDDDTRSGSYNPQPPSVIPRAPSPPTPASGSEIYGPERLYGQKVAAAAALTIAQNKLRDHNRRKELGFPPPLLERKVPSYLPDAPPPKALLSIDALARLRNAPDLTMDQLGDISLQAEWLGRQEAGILGMSIKDEIAWEAGKVTPGVDDTPYILYAIEAITRDRDTGASGATGATGSGSSGEDSSAAFKSPVPKPIPTGVPPTPREPEVAAARDSLMATRPPPRRQSDRRGSRRDSRRDNRRDSRRGSAGLPHQPPSPASSVATLVHHHAGAGPAVFAPTAPLPPVVREDWMFINMSRVPRDVQRLNPPANFRPPILRPWAMALLILLCALMLVALVFSAVWSQLRVGFVAYNGTIHGGQYFLFRMLPQLVAASILLWTQAVASATLRVLPFAKLASPSPSERRGALFEDFYCPTAFLFPPLRASSGGQTHQPWQVSAFMLVAWLSALTLPLQSSLFTVVYVFEGGDPDPHWRWAAVQGVAWTLVAMYVALIAAASFLMLYWVNIGVGRDANSTGVIWDPRSIADVAALVAHGGAAPPPPQGEGSVVAVDPSAVGGELSDYRGTEVMGTREELRWHLRGRDIDRLAYWSTAHYYTPEYWYGIGGLKRYELWLRDVDAKNGTSPQQPPHPPPSSRTAYTRSGGGGSSHHRREKPGEKLDGEIDIEASPHSPRVRYRFLPWCMRTSPLLLFVVAAFVLLVALLVVSFLPSTNIRQGFLPGLPAGPVAGAFSAADFLYSFLPSLLGLVLFLLFQVLEHWLRILTPWGELSQHRRSLRGGALAERSILADYAACNVPLQAALHALRNGHWRVAALSLLSTLFVLLPVLGGGVFMALTVSSSTGEVRMLPNVPAFAVLCALLLLFLLGLLAFLPGRKAFRLPHGVTCLAEIISFVANDDLCQDRAFRDIRNKTTLRGKIGVDRAVDEQDRWVFGLGPGRDARLGVRRLTRFTELQRRMSRRQRRQTGFGNDDGDEEGRGRGGGSGDSEESEYSAGIGGPGPDPGRGPVGGAVTTVGASGFGVGASSHYGGTLSHAYRAHGPRVIV